MIYLDHAATTPLDESVLDSMRPWLSGRFGNPSSVHAFGREARAAVENARGQIAAAINAAPDEIVFTSSATEANNLVIKGSADVAGDRPLHILTTAVEHPCVKRPCEYLSVRFAQVDVTFLGVDGEGMIAADQWAAAMRDDTILASALWVNNETGVIQDVEALATIAYKKNIPLHLDAVQALGRVPIDVSKIGCSFLSLSSHKIYGPKGVGALYIKEGSKLRPLLHGGAQERGRRGGTENVAGIVGFGRAAEIAISAMEKRREQARHLESTILATLRDQGVEFHINGSSERRAPGIINLSFPGISGQDLLIALDLKGFAVSSGSACSSGVVDVSPVLAAMHGADDWRAKSGIRISVGVNNTANDMKELANALAAILARHAAHRDAAK